MLYFVAPKTIKAPASDLMKVADGLKANQWIIARVSGDNVEGKAFTKTIALPTGEGKDGRERIKNGGVTLSQLGGDIEIAQVKFGSRAKKLGVDQGYKITELQLPNPARPNQAWGFIPGLLLAGLLWWWQRREFSQTGRT